MDKIKNVIFDVGMVLIDFCWDGYCRELGFSEEIIAEFEKMMITSKYWHLLDEGTMTEEDAIIKFKEEIPQYAKEIDTFWEHPEHFVKEYDFAAPLVDELHSKGYYVYLLSNYPLRLHELHWNLFKFFPKIDGYIVSAKEKLCKPDPAIYHLLCDRYNLDPSECLFVDDRQENVDAARSIGMDALLFTDEKKLREYIFR
jgi:putative hydrolase of the HAD superfamily